MGKNKLKRFAENATFPNLIQPSFEEVFHHDYCLKGKWHDQVFGNSHPIVVELGCGKGEYTVGLAKQFPEKNFIGIDIKGARLWRGAKDCLEQKITNARFLRMRIEFINAVFDAGEVSEIWLTFPDPQQQKSRHNKRLTGPRFLESYAKFLVPGGIIHLKTDSDFLYEYTMSVIRKNNLNLHVHTPDLYHSPYVELTYGIKTFYEKMFLEQQVPIKYIQFDLNHTSVFKDPEEE